MSCTRYCSRGFENSFCSVVRVNPGQPYDVNLLDFCCGSMHVIMLNCSGITDTLNSKFLHTRKCSLSGHKNNIFQSNLLILTYNFLLNFGLAFEGNIIFETGFEFPVDYSAL